MRSIIIQGCYCSGCFADFYYETTDYMIPMYCDKCMKDRIKDGVIERRGNRGDRRNNARIDRRQKEE